LYELGLLGWQRRVRRRQDLEELSFLRQLIQTAVDALKQPVDVQAKVRPHGRSGHASKPLTNCLVYLLYADRLSAVA